MPKNGLCVTYLQLKGGMAGGIVVWKQRISGIFAWAAVDEAVVETAGWAKLRYDAQNKTVLLYKRYK